MCAPVVSAVTSVAKGVGNLASDAVGYGVKKVTNTVKDVSGVTAAENAAKKAQQEADRKAEERRKELAALAQAREATAAQQQAQLVKMEADQARVLADQDETATGLRAENEAKLAGIRARGRAVTGSLKILAQDRKSAPTAAVNTKKPRTKSAKTTQASLRIASQGASGRGAGTNISV